MKTFERPFVETESLIAIFHHVAHFGQKIALNERYDVRPGYTMIVFLTVVHKIDSRASGEGFQWVLEV